MYFGQESFNWLLESVTSAGSTLPCGTPQTNLWGVVFRNRGFYCPDDYFPYTSDVCYRQSNLIDAPKNLGQTCPPNGQCMSNGPINFGVANKFRRELDYRAAGNSPLEFTRYYNSRSQNASNGHQYYHADLESTGGLGAYGSVSSQPAEQGTRLGRLGLGAVGVGWRHTYQRAIWSVESALETLPSMVMLLLSQITTSLLSLR